MLDIVILSDKILPILTSIIMLSNEIHPAMPIVNMLNVVMLNVVALNVVAPLSLPLHSLSFFQNLSFQHFSAKKNKIVEQPDLCCKYFYNCNQFLTVIS